MKRSLSLLVILFSIIINSPFSQIKLTGGFELGSYNGFYTPEEIIIELDSMRLNYPNLVSEKDSIGITWEDRPIWVVKISDSVDVDEDEPEIFLNSLIHGNEPMSMMVLMYYMNYLLENYGTDTTATYLVDNREIYFIPVFNPDGYYNHNRKNSRDNLDGSFGVDLNRNFGYKWGYDDQGSKSDPSHIMYRGPYAFSEPETQAIRDFCNEHNFITANNMHYYGYWLYIPFGYNITPTPDSSIFNLFTKLGTAINNYEPRTSFHPVNGTVADWMYGETKSKPKIFAITTEVGGKDISNYANPTNQDIWNTCLDGVYQNNIICLAPGIIEDIPYLSNIHLNKNAFSNENEQLIITAEEKNNINQIYNQTSTFILNDKDVIIDTLVLQYDSIGSISYLHAKINSPEEEGFYHLNVNQEIDDLGIIFDYSTHNQNLKFTNAGPMAVNVDHVEIGTNYDYQLRFAVTNLSENLTINKIFLHILNNDSAISLSPNRLALYNLEPGETVLSSYVYINVKDSSNNALNLNFEIEYDGFVYWRDTLSNYIITDVNPQEEIPIKFELIQNYPNPFNPKTKIGFALPYDSKVTLKVYDLLGREVALLVNGLMISGYHERDFDASKLSSGIYFYRLTADAKTTDAVFTDVKKLILIK